MILNRRRFLRSASVALALPVLPSLLPRKSWGSDPDVPARLLTYFVPNGLQPEAFIPDATGRGYDLKEILQPIAPVQHHVSIVSGLDNAPATVPIPGDHARGTGSFLTCKTVKHTAGNDIENGISFDQMVAQHLGHLTPFPSLQVGIQEGGNSGDCTAGYSCAYTRNISWAGPSTPLPAVTDPLVLFERMFGAETAIDPSTRLLRAQVRASILDEVQDEATALQSRIGAADQAKLDEYLTAVREVEIRAQALGAGSCGGQEAPPPIAGLPDHVAAMNDLMLLAMQCDITRVITFMLGPGGSNQSFDFIGVSGAHHQISHHQGDENALADLRTIGNWEIQQFADLVQRMADIDEGETTLLDNTLVYMSSEITDGDAHNHDNMPVAIAGGANLCDANGEPLHTPGHHAALQPRPLADLYLTIMRGFGVDVDSFGDSTGAFTDLVDG